MRYVRKLIYSCLPFVSPFRVTPSNALSGRTFYEARGLPNYQINQSALVTDNRVQLYFNKINENPLLIPEDIKPYQKEALNMLLKTRNEIFASMNELEELKNDKKSDEELQNSISEEYENYKEKLLEVEGCMLEALLPSDVTSEFNEVVIEVSPGVGGQEAMLFAKTLFEMYMGYVDYKGWDYTLAEHNTSELGGLRFGSILINGEDVFKWLQFETGVHRVQRIPSTEKSGRVHTSTATVAVLPQPKEIHIKINETDLTIETKRASGAGGQHVNKTDSAVRLTHIPSGIVIDCQIDRSQIKNREIALKRLQAKLFQKQLDSQTKHLKDMRKLQVGSSSRSDKIRTYNFNQDRITDHRLTTNFHNLETFMEGSKLLDQMIEHLLELNNIKRMNLFLESISGINNETYDIKK